MTTDDSPPAAHCVERSSPPLKGTRSNMKIQGRFGSSSLIRRRFSSMFQCFRGPSINDEQVHAEKDPISPDSVVEKDPRVFTPATQCIQPDGEIVKIQLVLETGSSTLHTVLETPSSAESSFATPTKPRPDNVVSVPPDAPRKPKALPSPPPCRNAWEFVEEPSPVCDIVCSSSTLPTVVEMPSSAEDSFTTPTKPRQSHPDNVVVPHAPRKPKALPSPPPCRNAWELVEEPSPVRDFVCPGNIKSNGGDNFSTVKSAVNTPPRRRNVFRDDFFDGGDQQDCYGDATGCARSATSATRRRFMAPRPISDPFGSQVPMGIGRFPADILDGSRPRTSTHEIRRRFLEGPGPIANPRDSRRGNKRVRSATVRPSRREAQKTTDAVFRFLTNDGLGLTNPFSKNVRPAKTLTESTRPRPTPSSS